MKSVEDRVAVVTGGASGIGRALAQRFAAAGMAVVLADIEEGALKQTAEEMEEIGAPVLAVPTDVASPSSVEHLAAAACSRFGTVHVVCNNAGVSGHMGRSWVTPLEDWRWVLDVNLYGVIHGLQAFVPILVEQDEGHVVNTASGASWRSLPGMAPYGASKHAVLAVSQSLRHELEGAGSQVGVSVLTPPLLKTRILESERNWPDGRPPIDIEQDAGTEAVRDLLSKGMEEALPPEVVADAVLAGILENRFIVTSHVENVVAAAQDRVRLAAGEWSPWP